MNIKEKLAGLKNKKEVLLIGFAVLVAAALGAYALYFRTTGLSISDAKVLAEKFINENLLGQGMTASIENIVEEGGLYKISLDVSGQAATSYLTKDGKLFFTQALDIAEIEKQAADAKKQAETVKSDKPEVELFVMSYCPYGTQMEKGILPVLGALGDKINFLLKFVGYAMHDKKEVDENTRQYCIQKEQNDKLSGYLTCFLKAGDATGCIASTGVDNAKLANCVSAADAQFSITKNFNDKNSWSGQYPPFDINKADNEKYSVQGSPTLVINGTTVSTQRDPASILQAICSAFNNQPTECLNQLSAEQPAAGFGEGTVSGASNGNCGQ